MRILILLLLTLTPLMGSDFITFKSDEGAECTYHKDKLSVTMGVEALMTAEGEYELSQFINIYVQDMEKIFPKLVRMNADVYYSIQIEKKGSKYVAISGTGPFYQKASTHGTNKSYIVEMEKKNCQFLIDKILDLKLIPRPNEKTDIFIKKIVKDAPESTEGKSKSSGKSKSKTNKK